MSKDTVADWDTDESMNLDIGGISLAENVMRLPAVNDALREILAQIKTSGYFSGTTLVAVGATGVISFAAGDVTITHATNALAFAGASSGYSFDALVDLTPSGGGQIKFPGTQNASSNVNTLDDYEEGTFTPTLSFGGANVGISTSAAAGTYTKIGCAVFFNLNIVLTSKGSSTGSAALGGLPFTSRNDGVIAVPAVQMNNLSSVSGDLGATLSPNTTVVSLSYLGTGTNTTLTDANFTNTTIVRVSGCYFAA